MSTYRLMVRTPGFQSGNASSILARCTKLIEHFLNVFRLKDTSELKHKCIPRCTLYRGLDIISEYRFVGSGYSLRYQYNGYYVCLPSRGHRFDSDITLQFWLHGLAVMTLPCHGSNTSSILVGVANLYVIRLTVRQWTPNPLIQVRILGDMPILIMQLKEGFERAVVTQ